MRLALAALVCALVPAVLSAQDASIDWTPAERAALERALHAINASPKDLGYNKRPFNDRYRLDVVNACLDDPLATLREVDRMRDALTRDPSPLGLAYALPSDAKPISSGGGGQYEQYTRDAPPAIRYALLLLMEALHRSNELSADGAPDLSNSERQALLRHAPGLALEEKADFHFSYYAEPAPRLPAPEVWALLDRVHPKAYVEAAERLYHEMKNVLDALELARGELEDWTGSVTIATPLGKVMIGGTGDDRHDCGSHVAAVIDLGGNDTYTGEAASGLGRTAVLIDFDGDDRYDLGDLSGGAGLLGVGMLYDLGGNDVYRAGHLSLGCGLCGVGILLDKAGDDIYAGKTMTQGFAMYGLGWLDDAAGSDGYRAQLFAQGASRTMGVGLLADRGGNDTYRAGGWALHSPLFADVHYSFAQGFSIGYREDTGGRSGGGAMLFDAAGDDAYVGETYCQGASYWFSFAALLDLSGHDSYDAYHYAQASSMHLTAAALVDQAGDDSYSCKFGASLAIGHDYGVAVMVDRAGNDLYTARDGTPGIGNANGVGVFLDAAGDDRYQGPPGLANPARGSGSVGLFVDMGGADKYYTGLADGEIGRSGEWGTALDLRNPPPVGTQSAEGAPVRQKPPEPGSLPDPGRERLEQLYKDACLWEVGTAVETVRKARAELIGIGMPACRFMVDEHLDDADRLADRAFVDVLRAVGPEAQALLIPRLDDPDDVTARNALRLVTDLKVTAAAPKLQALLSREGFLAPTTRAAGALRAASLAPALAGYITGEDESAALAAAIALGDIGSPESAKPLVDAFAASSLPVREAAASALVRIGLPAMRWVLPATEAGNPTVVRLALSALRRLKAPQARDVAVRLLDHEDWGVRLDAVDTLFAIGQGTLAMLNSDREKDPYVKARILHLANEETR